MIKSKIEKAKRLILPISGGIGRNIFATAVIKNLKKAYPDKKIFVIAGYTDIFTNNPNISKLFGFNTVQHLYKDYIDRYEAEDHKHTLLLEVEPYRHPDYLTSNIHIVEAWCDLLDIPCEDVTPELYLTRNEKEMGREYINQLKVKYNKPVILMQSVGGKMPNKNERFDQIANLSEMHRRSLREKTIQEVVDKLSKDGYTVASVCGPNQFCANGSERICLHIRSILSLLPHVSGVIAIDSFLQHSAAALGVPALVLWAGTSPERLGYKIHTNLRRNVCSMPECHRPNSFAYDVNTNGFLWDCPFSDACTDYESETIVQAYKDMKGEEYEKEVKEFKKPTSLLDVTQTAEEHNHSHSSACPVHGENKK